MKEKETAEKESERDKKKEKEEREDEGKSNMILSLKTNTLPDDVSDSEVKFIIIESLCLSF